jgi:hypothetical protein
MTIGANIPIPFNIGPVPSFPPAPTPAPAPAPTPAAQPLPDFIPLSQQQSEITTYSHPQTEMERQSQPELNHNYRTPIRNRVDRNISYPRIDRYTERPHRNGNAPYHRRYYPHNNRYFNQTSRFNPMTGLPYNNNYNNRYNDRPHYRNHNDHYYHLSPRRVTFRNNSSPQRNNDQDPSNYNNFNNYNN